MNILEEIVAYKKTEMKRQKKAVPFLELVKALDDPLPAPRFMSAIRETGIHLIAEVKKASPSAGIIRENFDAGLIARSYQEGGACCLSVVTEDKFFKGSLSYLKSIAAVTDLPLLRKDFIIDEYQVYESKAHSADAVLLIAALLNEDALKDLLDAAADARLDALVEVHSEDELNKALAAGSCMIGINTRDLKDFTIDLHLVPMLLEKIPSDKLVVCESGIKSLKDLDGIKVLKVNAVLVGEALMRAKDTAAATREFCAYLKKS
jgi:indole-3-glycerol phosphate synthase